MAAAIYDLFIEQGVDYVEGIDITGSYTGYSIRGTIKDRAGVLTPNIVSWVDESIGELEVTLTDLQTEAMSSGLGKYDIEIVSPTGIVSRILKGRVYVDSEVTI